MGAGSEEDTNRMLSYDKQDRAIKTYGTGSPERLVNGDRSTVRNSMEDHPSYMNRDNSLDRLDKDAMSLDNGDQQQQRPSKQVNITN